MSYLVKNKDDTFLISFSKVKDNDFMILATNLKSFYVQKSITSEFIHESFNESITRLRLQLSKIIKIMQEEEPENDSELKVLGNTLNLMLKFKISLNKNLHDSFKINFKLNECTSIPEIGELFFTGLLKTLIKEKLKAEGSEKFHANLPTTSFEATFKVNERNISDLCQLVGGGIESNTDNSDQIVVEELNTQPKQSTSQKTVKRLIVTHNELKFEQLDDSQEIVTKIIEEPKEVPTKKPKKKLNIKF